MFLTKKKIPYDFEEQCGGLIEAFSFYDGQIRSPKDLISNSSDTTGILNYPTDQDCFWNIKANNDSKIIINITHMDIEGELVGYISILVLNRIT